MIGEVRGPVPPHSQEGPAGEVSQSELRVREAVLAADRLMDDVNDLQEENARQRAVIERMLAVLQDVAKHFEGTDAPLGERARAVIAKAESRQP
jgi:hypothetical protein